MTLSSPAPRLLATSLMVATIVFGPPAAWALNATTIKPLVVTKAIDDCSPLLFKAAFMGQHLPTATLQVGTKTGPFFSIQLTTVLVIDLKADFVRTGGSPAGDDVLAESLTLDAAAFSFTSGGTTVGCNQQTGACQ